MDLMRSLSRRNTLRSSAKRCARIRPPYGMSGPVALTGLTALLALAGCFQLNVDQADSCRLVCSPGEACPGNFKCLFDSKMNQGLCASPETAACQPIPNVGMDASV